MNRAVLLAAAVGLLAVMGSTVIPAVGGLLGFWRFGSVGWKLLHVMGTGQFAPVAGASKDVFRCAQLPLPTPAPPFGSCRLVGTAVDLSSLLVDCRLDLWWRPLPVVVMPLTAVLVREGHTWALIDAGAPDSWSQGYASLLVKAVQATIPKGDSLQAILRERAGSTGRPSRRTQPLPAATPSPANSRTPLLPTVMLPLPAACTPAPLPARALLQ